MKFAHNNLQRVLCLIDSRWTLQSVEPIAGRAVALRVASRGQDLERLVLLTHSEADRERNPHIAHDEFRTLQILREAGMPVPKPRYLCERHEPPCLITSYVQGESRFKAEALPAFCRKLAAGLHAVHAINPREYDLEFLPQLGDLITCGERPLTAEQQTIHAAMKRALPAVEFNAPALLHGDYWLGNLLWRGDQLGAIIDWEDAMTGDPLADLGKSRLEILWALGIEAMDLFTRHYLALNQPLDAKFLPYWDLWGASRLSHYAAFAADPGIVPQMRAQYGTFVSEAIRRLNAVNK